MAVTERFELSKGCPLHTFQACSFSHSDTSPDLGVRVTLLPRRANVSKRGRFGKPFFHCFQPLVTPALADSPVMN